jgi:hypothetical protein
MNLKRIKHYIIFITVFFSSVNIANAEVVINEVKISPTGDRFIELYNSGSSSVDLTNWYLQRKTSTGSDFGSLASKTYFSGKSIEAKGYFVISKTEIENTDIIYGSLTLTESNVIQLKNGSQELIDKVGWGEVSDCGDNCAPNPTTGNSIGRISRGNWVSATSTPGGINSSSGNEDGGDENVANENSDTEINPITQTSATAILKITTKIISPKIVVAGIPFSVNSETTTNRGETYAVGKYVWNFGDGGVREVRVASPFEYAYDYPGEYVLSLSYFASTFSKEAEATNRITIKVIPSDIYISSVGNDADPYIELENKSKYEVILSKWIINAGAHYFVIPEGTTLLPGKKIKLSPKITGFTGEDIKYISISTPSREVVATYPIQIKRIVQKTSVVSGGVKNIVTPIEKYPSENSNVINLNDLGASVSDSGVNISKSAYPIIGLILVIGIGIASFLMIKNKNKDEVGDYIEREIRAEDMKIIE